MNHLVQSVQRATRARTRRDPTMKQMHLGVFEVAGPQVGGTLSWPHPRSDSLRFHELEHWIHIAQVLDAAGFDFLFSAAHREVGQVTVDRR